MGTGRVADHLKTYRVFIHARAFARRLGLRSVSEWRAFVTGRLPDKGNLPTDIPSNPDNTYRDKGWRGYSDWLGNTRPKLETWK